MTTGVNSNSGWARIFQYGASSTTNSNTLAVTDNADFFNIYWLNSSGTSFCGPTGVGFNNQLNLHVVMTLSAGDYARLYINGVLAGTTPLTINPLPPATAFLIGKSFDSANSGLIGSVNEFRIWGGALSATDIATRYSQGPGKGWTEMSRQCLSHSFYCCSRNSRRVVLGWTVLFVRIMRSSSGRFDVLF